MEFDEASGVPTVWISYRVALGHPVDPCFPSQRDGVFYVDLLSDLATRIVDGESLTGIGRHYLGLLFKRRSGQYFAWDDPLPGLLRITSVARQRTPGLVRRLGRLVSLRPRSVS